MLTTSEAAGIAVGGAIAGAQTLLLREYVDKPKGILIPRLGGFGTASALGGIILGIGTIAYGSYRVTKGGNAIAAGLLGYGFPALVGGIISGLHPVPPPPPAIVPPAVPPAIKLVPVAGTAQPQAGSEIRLTPSPPATPAHSTELSASQIKIALSAG